ncbi:MAG: flagellar hook-length control protein FliK [Candidatus Kapaibacteriales bacterium]
MNAGMLQKLSYNFEQKNVQFPDTKSNIEQKDCEKYPSFIPDFLSQLFSLFKTYNNLSNKITNTFELQLQDLVCQKINQSETDLLTNTSNINQFPTDKIIHLLKDKTSSSISESQILSNLLALNNHMDNQSAENELSDSVKTNILSTISKQLDAIVVKFETLRKADYIGNFLPDYHQSINHLGLKIVSKPNQVNSKEINVQKDNNLDGNIQLQSEPELPSNETLNHSENLSKPSTFFHTSKVSNSKLDDTTLFVTKQPAKFEFDRIDNDKTLETMKKNEEDAFSQKYKIAQTEERIFNSSANGEEIKNWTIQLQFTKNQGITKSVVENSNHFASESPTTIRLYSRYYEIPSKIVSILNTGVQLPARAEIQLQPNSLGMVIVVVTASQNSVDITMQVKDQETLKILENYIAPLREKLNQLGFENTNIELQLNQWTNGNMQNQYDNKTADYLLRQKFLRSFARLQRNEVQNFYEFISNTMGVI